MDNKTEAQSTSTGNPGETNPPENAGTLTVSYDKPEMAMLQGGLFVMSIPLNSKGMNRVLATGFAFTALGRLCAIYDDMERLKREHDAKKKPGLIIAGADAVIGNIKKLVGI